jgi:thioredoxin reductase
MWLPVTTTGRDDAASGLPVVVIGAGPVGLAAAAHLLRDGLAPLVVEVGDQPGSSVLEWGHVQLFSPWRYDIDAAAAALLTRTGWQAPDLGALPTGRALVREYLEPLSRVDGLQGRVLTSTRVIAVTRAGADKVRSDRDDAPFLVRVGADGSERDIVAAAVIDASGTWGQPNPLGADGIPALGEPDLRDALVHGVPDVRADRARYAGRTTAVVGSGHSAAGTVLALAALRAEEPDTVVHWVIRGHDPRAFEGGTDDELPARGALGSGTRGAVRSGAVRLTAGFRVQRVSRAADGVRLRLTGSDGRFLDDLDEVVVATGQRPDLAVAGELRLDLDPALESTRGLNPLIDPDVHSCGTVRPHSYLQLAHAEPGFFTVGAKSYGRAPTFLLATGYEQVRSVSAHLAGNEERALRVSLVLPGTGRCGSSGGSGCCSTGRSSDEPPASVTSETASSCCG